MKSEFDKCALTPGFIIRNEIERVLRSASIFEEIVCGDSIKISSSVFSNDGIYVGNFEITIKA